MISRLTSEVFIPWVPIVIPSEIETVLSSIGVPPASLMPSLTFSARLPVVVVAGHRLDPGVRNADDGLVEVFICVAHPLEIRARRRAVPALEDRAAPVSDVGLHGFSPS